MHDLQSICFLLDLILMLRGALCSGSSIVRGRYGGSVILECGHDPGETFLQITWKIDLYNSICKASMNKLEARVANQCNTKARMELNNQSLTINNITFSDEGTYRCESVNAFTTFFNEITLKVFAQPSVILEINGAGIPECTAHGAYPAAEISWTPHTDNIATEHFQYDNKTWTSTSRYNLKNVTRVTCRVSHPTFTSPQEKSIILHGTKGKHLSWKILAYIIFPVVTFTLFIFMKIKTKTICCQKEPGEHHHTKVMEIPPTPEEVIDPRSLQPIHEASPEESFPGWGPHMTTKPMSGVLP